MVSTGFIWPNIGFYPEPVECSPPFHSIYLIFILTLFSHLRWCLPSDPFPSVFPTQTVYASLFSPMRATYTYFAHLNLLDLIILNINLVRSRCYEVSYYGIPPVSYYFIPLGSYPFKAWRRDKEQEEGDRQRFDKIIETRKMQYTFLY
jgi:hypothetical protein